MDYDQLMEKIQAIREGRSQPSAPTNRGKTEKKQKSAVSKLETILAGMSEEEKAALLKSLEG